MKFIKFILKNLTSLLFCISVLIFFFIIALVMVFIVVPFLYQHQSSAAFEMAFFAGAVAFALIYIICRLVVGLFIEIKKDYLKFKGETN